MNDRQPSGGPDLLLGLAAGALGLGVVLWSAAAASAWLSGHRPLHPSLFDGYRAFTHLGDPSLAWSAPVGPSFLYWALTVVALLLVGLIGYGGWRLWHSAGTGEPSGPRRAGMAARREVKRAAGEKALLARSATLRPSLNRPRPADVGYQLGASRGVKCWASVEDSMLVLGPPRSGKGLHEVVRMLLDAPGAVVTTSTRPDNLAVTLEARATRGPVMVFDPQGLAGPNPASPGLRWSLTRGCEHPQAAMVRADALVPDAGRSGVENANFWRAQALSVTRCLLHAAALTGRPPADLFRWSHTAGAAKEAVTILGTCPGATPGWDRALDAVISADERTRDSVWAMVANTFAPLADPAVLAAVTPEEGAELDPLAFLALEGTVYLLGTATGASATATLVAGLIEDLVDAARRLAARSPGPAPRPAPRPGARRSPQLPAPVPAFPHVRRGRLGHHHGGRPPVAGPGP